MNESSDIEIFTRLQKLISIFQKVNQISWASDQTKKRYPAPEAMTKEEMEALTKHYLALGLDIEDVYKDWKNEYETYRKKA